MKPMLKLAQRTTDYWQEMLYKSINRIDNRLLKQALLNGAIVNNNNCKKHTLNTAIRSMLSYTNRFNLEFIEDLMDRGAEICNDQTINNTMTIIAHHSLRHIEIAIKQSKHADAEKNILDPIQSTIDRGAIPCNELDGNTLDCAIPLCNYKIIEKIVMRGGESKSNYTFQRICTYAENNTINQIMILLMCTGKK